MTCCPHHGQVPAAAPADCPLQLLADATIMATHAAQPGLAVVVILVDLSDGHTAMSAGGLPPSIVARVLADEAEAIRQGAS